MALARCEVAARNTDQVQAHKPPRNTYGNATELLQGIVNPAGSTTGTGTLCMEGPISSPED